MRKLLILAAAFFLVRWSEVSYQFTPTGRGPYMPHVNRTGGERRFETLKEANDWMDMMFPPDSGVRNEMHARIVKVEEIELPSRGRK